jgi:hypothetical protein
MPRRRLLRAVGLAIPPRSRQFLWARQDPLQGHRPFGPMEQRCLRDMRGGMVPPDQNPGVRLTPDLVTPEEERELVAVARDLVAARGVNMVPAEYLLAYQRQMAHLPHPPPVNVTRVTGRYEGQGAGAATWGYGDSFKVEALPTALQRVAARIQSHPDFRLGPLRDVTINRRQHGYFRLDPHVDPLGDGENVFVLGLASDTVLTLSPVGVPLERDPRAIETRSWSSSDIDCLLQRRSLLHLCGPARNLWTHGTRQGVPPEAPGVMTEARPRSQSGAAAAPLLSDWFGTPDTLVPREPERLSIVFAFRHPSPQLFPSSWLGGNQY